MVSRPTDIGGLGFGMKWNMGWMHDTLATSRKTRSTASYHHGELTFSLVYAFNENFVLPLSHDEVVHGKGSLIGKMPGDDWQQFANLRALFGYMWGHPGKKLLFMGGEFGQRREWTHDGELEWWVAGDREARRPAALGARAQPASTATSRRCTRSTSRPQGFEWIERRRQRSTACSPSCASRATASGRRAGGLQLDAACRAATIVLGVPPGGFWREMLNSDATDLRRRGLGQPRRRRSAARAGARPAAFADADPAPSVHPDPQARPCQDASKPGPRNPP